MSDQTETTELEHDAETAALLRELDQIAEKLEPVDDLYARRTEIFLALRDRQPPVKYREIADAARSSEDAVTQAIRKARRSAS